jgi:hypothetical protein
MIEEKVMIEVKPQLPETRPHSNLLITYQFFSKNREFQPGKREITAVSNIGVVDTHFRDIREFQLARAESLAG